jgi:hypothetical protein
MSERISGREESADQLDEIGRRIEGVIGDQDQAVTEHVRPHWEVLYDAAHAYAARIVHLHGERKEATTVGALPNGEAVASCTGCPATLQISRAAPVGGDRRAVAPIG